MTDKQLSTLIKLSNESRYLVEESLVPTGEFLCIVKKNITIIILSQNQHIKVVNSISKVTQNNTMSCIITDK